ncbi:MAG TPA: amidohydrolase, partial [Acidobacteriota bacterium]|nr:amidohydrolase [Acidobacteriota bacterium]
VPCRDRNEVISALRERAKHVAPGEWILGRGWRISQMGGFPHRKTLDDIFPENPVVLHSHDEHLRWLNTKALQACGITQAVPVDGGFVGADPDGSANGILGENAIALLRPHLPVPDRESRRRALIRAQQEMHSLGIVGIHSMDAGNAFGDLQDLHADGRLHLRVFHSIPIRQLEHAVEIGLKTGMGDDWFRFGPVKIFSDGALGSQSAWMLEPYLEGGAVGIEIMPEQELTDKIKLALTNGIAVAVHAIGDRANRQCLNAFQANAHLLGIPSASSRIEHAQLLHHDDIPRFAQIGILASMQPYHAVSDQPLAERYWGDRARYSYAWRSLLEQGATLLFGSDSPVEDPDPLQGLQAAVQRQNWTDRSQTISAAQTLLAYTRTPAYASGELKHRGTLERGKLADFTIFSDDPVRAEFRDVRVLGTAIQGNFVYRDF